MGTLAFVLLLLVQWHHDVRVWRVTPYHVGSAVVRIRWICALSGSNSISCGLSTTHSLSGVSPDA